MEHQVHVSWCDAIAQCVMFTWDILLSIYLLVHYLKSMQYQYNEGI